MMLQWSNTVFFVLSSLIGLVLWPGMLNFSGLDMDFCFDGSSLVLRLHPYFTVWTSQLPEGVEGYALGFVAFCKAPFMVSGWKNMNSNILSSSGTWDPGFSWKK